MKPPEDVSCQDALFSSLFCRFTLPFFFFLLTFVVPLNAWGYCVNITSPVVGDVWYTGETHNIQWNTDSTNSTVTIYLYKNGNRQGTIVSDAPNNGSYSWTIPTYKEGNNYAVEVWTGDCYSYKSKDDYFTLSWPSTTLPRTPSSFTATPQSSTGIDLSWNFVSDATGYDVYTCAGSFIGNTTQTSYLVKGLNPETTYSYKVRANNDDGSSDFTACQTATTLSTDPDSYTISGRTKKADGTAILNATVTFTGLSSVQSIHNGEYSQTVPNGWSGEVCATQSSCNFACVSVSNVTADRSGVDLICDTPKYKISGYTQRYNGTHIPSVTVSFSGESSVTSNSNGYYEKYVEHGWSGTISAAKSGYTDSTKKPFSQSLRIDRTIRSTVTIIGVPVVLPRCR
ncbi:hypothetical protein GMJAKD_13450 [Candidatus Electrothrix aarhusensis]